jgi:hypothetical protein
MTVFQLRDDASPARPAPPWFVDWVRLGMQAAAWARSGAAARRVVVVSAPSEAMASSAAAFGYVRASFLQGTASEVLPQVKSLDALEHGTWIWFRAGNSVRTARFLELDARGIFRTSNGHFRSHMIKDVRILPPWLQPQEATADCSEAVDGAFLSQLLRGCDPIQFATMWSPRLALVGSRVGFNAELDVRLGTPAPDASLGALRQVVRPLTMESPVGCHSLLVSSRDEAPAWAQLAEPPAAAILRGAYATSRWLLDIPAKVVISVLGRAEGGLEAAVAAVMQTRAQADPVSLADLGWVAPRGCEVVAFDEVA